MNRRDFLRASALTPLVMSASPADDSKPQRIRCGILGIDHSHALDVLGVLQKSPDFDLVGVCEPDERVRATFAAMPALKNVRWLRQDELLRDDTVKMVAVESAVPRLLPLAREVMDADKHLHLDKPPGASFEEYRALRENATHKNRIVQMGYMFRYNPGFDLARRAVKEGWLGDIYAIHGSMCTDLTPEKRQRIGMYSGGMMLELGSHLIDVLVLLMGTPSKVTSFIRHDSRADDRLADNTFAVLEYPKCIATIDVAAMEPDAFVTRRFKVCGTRGSLVLSPLEPPAARLVLRQDAGEFKKGAQSVPLKDIDRHVLDFADMAACIRGERPFSYTKEHDLAAQKTLLQASGMLSET